MNISLGLCKGRHEIPDVTDYVFDEILDPTNVNELEKEVALKLSIIFSKVGRVPIEGANITIEDGIDVGYRNFRGSLTLYTTGLTVALLAVVNICRLLGIHLEVMHYNRDTNSYYPQAMFW